MPRKQNGFGNTRSFAVSGAEGINNRTDKGKGRGAAGQYPSNRRFGSSVTRSAIEQWDLDSTWARWRKGMEYYYQAAYLPFTETDAVLYQGSEVEVPVTFSGYRFATKNADSRTHYAIKRTIDSNVELGYVDEVYNDPLIYTDQFKHKELWVKVVAGRNIFSDSALLRAIGERITDGTTEANITNILTSDAKPAIYTGKSRDTGVMTLATIPLDEIRATTFVQENGIDSLVGETVYLPDFVLQEPIDLFDIFTDYDSYFTVESTKITAGVRVQILDSNSTLPPTLQNIQDLEPIYKTETSGGVRINGEFFFRKSDYQRFFGKKYLTAEVVQSEVTDLSYAIMPFTIAGIKEDPDTNTLLIASVPYQASMTLYTPQSAERIVVFADNSFTKIEIDNNVDGEYNHAPPKPDEELWRKYNLDINPWQDQTFQAGNRILYADLYTCSCPAYLHAKIRSPESYDEEGGKLNRQSRNPLPTAKGQNTYDDAGIAKVAGIIDSWADASYKKGFKVCKHTIASMFINKIRVQEPNTFPSVETRDKFEDKLAKDIQEVAEEFTAQLKRSEITTIEIVYALAEALNLNDVELGYVMQTASF